MGPGLRTAVVPLLLAVTIVALAYDFGTPTSDPTPPATPRKNHYRHQPGSGAQPHSQPHPYAYADSDPNVASNSYGRSSAHPADRDCACTSQAIPYFGSTADSDSHAWSDTNA